MSQRLNEYFAGEAADYLQQLSALLALPAAPDPVRLLRLATGVRGSTQMAGADDLADLAGHFESSAREMLQGSAEWSDDIRDLSRRTVSEMQALVYSIDRWGDEEASRIRAVARLWSSSGYEVDGDETIEPGDDGRPVVPISALFFDDAGPHVLEPEAADRSDLERVPIGDLLYSGSAAFQAAASLRSRLDEIVRGENRDESLEDVLNELFDLIDLGMASEAAEV